MKNIIKKNPASLKGKIGLFTNLGYYNTSRYPWAFDAFKKQNQIHWLAEEVPLGEDIKDWNTGQLTDSEKNLLTQIFRLFTQSDACVCENYFRSFVPLFNPAEIQMMFASFTNMEAIHQDAYSLLLNTVGMPESEFKAFRDYSEMSNKVDYMESFGVDTMGDLLKTMAMFGAFTEGLSLFASFAMLLNFPRFNKMKGMGQIVTWSVRDECVSPDTQVLTEKGWVDFPDLKDGDKVAQFDPQTKEVSFVVPNRVIRKHHEGTMYNINKRQLSVSLTPNHDVLYYYKGEPKKEKASTFNPNQWRHIPIAGIKNSEFDRELTSLERIKIAYAADGHKIIGDNRTGKKCGYQRACFTLTKQRKIDRLLQLCNDANINIIERPMDKRGRRIFSVDFPVGHAQKQLSDWVDLSSAGSLYAKSFIDELVLWDGHVNGKKKMFCSTNKKDVELAQALAVFCNISTSLITTIDTRKNTYKDYYRLGFWDNDTTPARGDTGKTESFYSGMVYCVEVPTGSFVIRKDGCVSITGNCMHTNSMIKLFHTLIQETGIAYSEVEEDITEVGKQVVTLEDKFAELAFELGDVKGMTLEDIKSYVRYIADWRLTQLNLRPVYGYFTGSAGEYKQEKEHPLPWLTEMLNGVEHANFFEARATEYTKGATKGKWEGIDGVWSMFERRKGV